MATRTFYLELARQFDELVTRARPGLDRVFREWMERPLSADLWQDVRLAGFGVADLGSVPRTWEVTFETRGDKWPGVTIPFVGELPQDPVVDT